MEITSLEDVESIGLLDELREDYAKQLVDAAGLQDWFNQRSEGHVVGVSILDLLQDTKKKVRFLPPDVQVKMRGKEV